MQKKMRWIEELSQAMQISVKSEQQSFNVLPFSVPFGVISAIRVQDIPRNIWYNWGYPGGKEWTPSEPKVTVGSGALYIAFWVTNTGTDAALFTLTVQDDTGKNLAQKYVSIPGGGSAGIEAVNLEMPNRTYGIRCIVVP